MKGFDLGSTGYTAAMNEKTNQYNALIRKAEVLNRDNGGKVTKQEAEFYLSAAAVCEEIKALNVTERAVAAQWEMRRADCVAEVKRIADILAPKPAPRPAPAPVPNAPAEKPAAQTNVQTNSGTAAPQTGAPVKTASGFVTKNASKDVPADMIESWHQFEAPHHTLADVDGMEQQKQLLLDQVAALGWERVDKTLGISPVQSFFFYGPAGTGKTFFIEGFAAELMNRGFHYIRLLGSQIRSSLVGVAEKIVTAAFAEAVDNAPCILFIDEIDNVCVNKNTPNIPSHEQHLTTAFLEAYNRLKESGKRIIFMGATNFPTHVDGAMLDRVHMVKVPLPNRDAREQYCKRAFKNEHLAPDLTFAAIADETENYSFRDMDRLRDDLKLRVKAEAIELVKQTDGISDQEQADVYADEAIKSGRVMIDRFSYEKVKKQTPPSDKTDIRLELEAFEERLHGNA